jgi:hypothetical protein
MRPEPLPGYVWLDTRSGLMFRSHTSSAGTVYRPDRLHCDTKVKSRLSIRAGSGRRSARPTDASVECLPEVLLG